MKYLMIALCLCFSLATQAQKEYKKEWREVEALQKKGLPRSVSEACDKIFQEAREEGNFPQQLRAFLTRMNVRAEMDRDSFFVDFNALRVWEEQTTDTLQQSVLAQILARKLTDYSMGNAYTIRQQSDPEEGGEGDLRTWSSRQIRVYLTELLQKSLAYPAVLAKATTTPYEGIVEFGASSRYFLHDMLHLIGFESAEMWRQIQRTRIVPGTEVNAHIQSIYTTLTDFYAQQGSRSAFFLSEINLLELQRNTGELNDSIYLIKLSALIDTHRDLAVCAEGYLLKARVLTNTGKRVEALAELNEALQRYDRYDRIGELKALKAEILNPVLRVQAPRIVYPGEQIKLQVQHKNLTGFTLRFYPVHLGVMNQKLNDYQEASFLKKYGGKSFESHFTLLPSPVYDEEDTTYYVTAPAHGIYVAEVIATTTQPAEKDRLLFHVSSLKALSGNVPNGGLEYVVLDRKTGTPVPDAKLYIYANQKGEYLLTDSLRTDAEGRCQIQDKTNKSFKVYVQHGQDQSLPWLYGYNYSRGFVSDDDATANVQLLTDRGLYRPGQTVHVKGIAYRQNGDSTAVISGKEFTLTLLDANRKEVEHVTLRSNEWGSFTHSFVLPTRTLNGVFTLNCDKSYAAIRVEEYKRPTFEVLLDTLKTAPQLGDSVTLTGRALTLNGFPLPNDSVSYTVLREPRYLWRFMDVGPQVVASGSTQTDAQGNFQIPFFLEPPTPSAVGEQAYRFRVQVDVIDVSGETQRGESSVSAGTRSLVLSSDLGKEWCKDSLIQGIFRAENLNGTPVSVQGTATLSTAKDKQVVWSMPFHSNTLTSLSGYTPTSGQSMLKQLPSGKYLLKLSAMDAQNRPCTWEQEITVFGMNDTRPPVEGPIWSKQFHSFFPTEGAAEILFGTDQKDVHLMYDLYTHNKRLESKTILLSDTLLHISLPYQEAYGDGVWLNLSFVKEGTLYQQNYSLRKPLPKKDLHMKWEVFRDHLQPGQREEWKLTIHTPHGQAAQAELMASMYDASLDKLYPFQQNFLLNYTRRIPSFSWSNQDYTVSAYISGILSGKSYPALAYDHWKSALQTPELLSGMRMAGRGILRKSARLYSDGADQLAVSDAIGEATVPQAKMMNDEVQVEESAVEATGGGEYMESLSGIRENFDETAFFYPQLRTNENGEVVISFTLPESLTKWKFMGIAHTKDVQTGLLEGEATVSKPFMLTAHLPRYLRQGDQTSLGGTIRNNSTETVRGTVRCEIFDPSTQKILKQMRQSFAVAPDSVLAVSFLLEPLNGQDLVGVRMTADGGVFVDGEQHLLALLSDKTHLIESIPLTLRESGTKDYSLASLFNTHSATATDRKLTVELTANPTWLAVQALPYLNTPTDEDVLSFATAYYANTLSGWIVRHNPTLENALKAWKTNPPAAESNLQRNTELKELLLEETPWVAEAEDEAQRRARLATLADANTLEYQRGEMLQNLNNLQLADGSFPWFKGMSSSSSTTNYVLETLGRLPVLTGEEDPVSQSIRTKAYAYLHAAQTKAYNQMTANAKKNYTLNESDLTYLYLCTLTKDPVPATAAKAHQFYLNALRPALTDISLLGRATATLVLLHENRKAEATDFYRSLKEYAVGNDEMGLYYANAGLNDPTRILSRAIEAALAMNDSELAGELKIQLLRQKQTRMWKSTVSTANAVYALLKDEKSLTAGQGEATLTIGKSVVRVAPKAGDPDAVMGYTKVSFTGKETQAQTAKFSYTGTGLCWGAIYGESMEQLDRVQAQGVQVTVKKELFVKRVRPGEPFGGIVWERLTDGTSLRQGDQLLTRLTVISDRDMDFVTLKDQRAACLEPVRALSGYRNGYYLAEKDASSNLFFDHLPKGTHTFELESYVTRNGTYNSGIAKLQSAYAAEFSGYSAAQTLVVE